MTRLSIHLVNFSPDGAGGWESMLERAVAADVAGIDRVLVSDHIAFGEDLSAYGDPAAGGTEGGRQPTGPDGHWLEPLTVLTAVAARTERVRLGTMVLLAALRRPAVLAKTLATLDVLSGGRVDLGVGVGWQRAEYDIAGLRYDGRGRLLDDTLALCQALWSGPVDGIHSAPAPVQPGGIPIWVSGRMNANVIARVVRFGAGWIPWGADDGDPGPAIARLRQALEEAGRDPGSLLVLGGLPVIRAGDGQPDLAATVAGAGPLLEAGVTDFRIGWPVPNGLAAATDALGTLVTAFRAAVA